MPIFTLWLQNRVLDGSALYTTFKPVYTSNDKGVTTWSVNFDDVFKGQNYKYKKCRVRIKAINITNGTPTFTNSLSYVGCSLASNYNDTNLLTPTLFNVTCLVDTTITSNRQTFIPSTDTAGSKGSNVNMPFGSQYLSVTFGTATNFTEVLEFSAASVDVNYNLLLHFELYDPIDEP